MRCEGPSAIVSHRAITVLELSPHLTLGRIIRPRKNVQGCCQGCTGSMGGPLLKPVIRTNSFSKAAAACGARTLRVSTEFTAWKYASLTSRYFLPLTFEGRTTMPLRNA